MKKEKEDGAHLGSLEWKEILVDVWNNVYDVHGSLDLGTRLQNLSLIHISEPTRPY